MQRRRISIVIGAALAIFAGTLLVSETRAAGQTVKVLHDFNNNGQDGFDPESGLIFDAAGNLYGTTVSGGTHYAGTVFELTPEPGGGWSEKILHNFNFGADGQNPNARLILDASGNLYGTTFQGGRYGYGSVFELTPKAAGIWSEKILHSFNHNGSDGYNPYASGLIFDAAGSLYGTTYLGGTNGGGTVFKLLPGAGGTWTETILYNFNITGNDGNVPEAGLIFDSAGNLYGTTFYGGSAYAYGGTVFELSPTAGGSWTEKILHSFSNKGGWEPKAGLIFDAVGNLYGTTMNLGQDGGGTVFRLVPGAGGNWTERVLQNFTGSTDGFYPSGLVFDSPGNLYGTAFTGGAHNSGTVFELIRQANGDWTLKILLNFNGQDGYGPLGGLVLDSAGNLYGTTSGGGVHGGGTVFEITH